MVKCNKPFRQAGGLCWDTTELHPDYNSFACKFPLVIMKMEERWDICAKQSKRRKDDGGDVPHSLIKEFVLERNNQKYTIV